MKAQFLLFASLLLLCLGCKDANKEKSSKSSVQEVVKIEMTIDGMTCNGCEQTIQAKVKKLEGIKQVQADHEAAITIVEFDKSQTKLDDIKKVIEKEGYKVTSTQTLQE